NMSLYPGLPGHPEGRTSRLLPIYGLHSNLVYLLTKLEIEGQFSSNSLLVGSGAFIECFHAHTEYTGMRADGGRIAVRPTGSRDRPSRATRPRCSRRGSRSLSIEPSSDTSWRSHGDGHSPAH